MRWAQLSEVALPAPHSHDVRLIASVLAGGGTGPWLLGGRYTSADRQPHVAIWSAPEPSGPWARDMMAPVAGLDGPAETVLGLTRSGRTAAAVASFTSPREGYPRPSTWVTSGGGRRWREQVAPRELFGGPDVVAVGGMSAGPHGFSVAGGWTGAKGLAVAAIWRSADTAVWRRDSTDPAFIEGQGSVATTVADGPAGLLLAGDAAEPAPADPLHQVGALWLSRAGTTWRRLPGGGLSGRGQTVVSAAAVTSSGWLAGGSITVSGLARPAVWTVSAGGTVRADVLSLPTGRRGVVTSVAVLGGVLVAAGVSNGQPTLWERTDLGSWHPMTSPKDPRRTTSRAVVAIGAGSIMLVASSTTTSDLWWANF